MSLRNANRLISVAMILIAAGVVLPWLKDKYDNRPPWWDPVWNLMVHDALKETARMAVISVLGAVTIGIVLGTALTIRFAPSRALIRAYVEVWRGLPIIVTIFLIYFALPQALPGVVKDITHISRLQAFQAATVGSLSSVLAGTLPRRRPLSHTIAAGISAPSRFRLVSTDGSSYMIA